MKYTILALVAFLGMSAQALASTGDMLHFFQSMEGDWQGAGIQTYNGETPSTTNYDYSLGVEYSGNRSWRMVNTLISDNQARTMVAYFYVREDALWIQPEGVPARAVAVIESTPKSLAYRYPVVEQPSGQVYEYTLHVSIADDGTLNGLTTIESNGMKIAEDQFSVKHGCTSVSPGNPVPAPSPNPIPSPAP